MRYRIVFKNVWVVVLLYRDQEGSGLPYILIPVEVCTSFWAVEVVDLRCYQIDDH